MTAGLLVACGDVDPRAYTPEEPSQSTSMEWTTPDETDSSAGATNSAESTTPDETDSSATSSTDEPTTYVPTGEIPEGEIWQWAVGQNVWEDPLYALSREQLPPGATDIYAHTLGFSLTPDVQGSVAVATLFNQGTGMEAYPGALPGGLDWSITGGDLLDILGDGSAVGPYPTDEFLEFTDDGYELTISTNAMHEEELPYASMTSTHPARSRLTLLPGHPADAPGAGQSRVFC
ncbi:MAG: hypothetical protein ABR500_03250 [Dermatophilaceae bacterium]|nr:hypothetical protein [Intrasporangiaceae bacterium]